MLSTATGNTGWLTLVLAVAAKSQAPGVILILNVPELEYIQPADGSLSGS